MTRRADGSEAIPESPFYDVMTRRDHERWMRNNRPEQRRELGVPEREHEKDLVTVAIDGRPLTPLERQLGGRFR